VSGVYDSGMRMRVAATLLAVVALVVPRSPGAQPVPPTAHRSPLSGPWRATLDLAGGPLRFSIDLQQPGHAWKGRLCNGDRCSDFSAVRVSADSVTLELADYAAGIYARLSADSLVGEYRNVGSRGPRVIPFRAARGEWPSERGPTDLLGRWDAEFFGEWGTSPRVFEFRNGPRGFEGTIISNSGDYGHFWGHAPADSFSLAHFDGSFVYMLTGKLDGDTLRGTFHAGLRTQTHWKAVRSSGRPHLKAPTDVTRADTTAPFRFSFTDLEGRVLTQEDPRLRGKVVLLDIFGTWCPTCHDAVPTLVRLWRKYHDQGLEILGVAFEVTGDTAVDGALVRRYRDKFDIPFPLLLGGVSDPQEVAAALPQLEGFGAFPTTVFLGRDGKVKRVQAGFYGPATGRQHEILVEDVEREVQRLLGGSQGQ
jgi:thiol-disulfide isomerase/thioredoxin